MSASTVPTPSADPFAIGRPRPLSPSDAAVALHVTHRRLAARARAIDALGVYRNGLGRIARSELGPNQGLEAKR